MDSGLRTSLWVLTVILGIGVGILFGANMDRIDGVAMAEDGDKYLELLEESVKELQSIANFVEGVEIEMRQINSKIMYVDRD